MADNYLERRMECLSAQPAAHRVGRHAGTVATRNRSVRGYDARFVVRRTSSAASSPPVRKFPSARNQQAALPAVLADGSGCWRTSAWRCALPEPYLPLAGTEPNAYRRLFDLPEDRWVDIDLGIAVQSMSCRRDRAQRALYRRVDRRRDSDEAAAALRTVADLAVGKSAERIERVEIGAGGDRRYLSFGGRPLCPQGRGADYRFGFGGNRR